MPSSEIFPPWQGPIEVTKDELLEVIDRLRREVLQDATMEGTISYGWSDKPGIYEVYAFMRTGNDMGQGGVLLLKDRDNHEMPPPPYPAELLEELAGALSWAATGHVAAIRGSERVRQALDHYSREVGRENVPDEIDRAIAELG